MLFITKEDVYKTKWTVQKTGMQTFPSYLAPFIITLRCGNDANTLVAWKQMVAMATVHQQAYRVLTIQHLHLYGNILWLWGCHGSHYWFCFTDQTAFQWLISLPSLSLLLLRAQRLGPVVNSWQVILPQMALLSDLSDRMWIPSNGPGGAILLLWVRHTTHTHTAISFVGES